MGAVRTLVTAGTAAAFVVLGGCGSSHTPVTAPTTQTPQQQAAADVTALCDQVKHLDSTFGNVNSIPGNQLHDFIIISQREADQAVAEDPQWRSLDYAVSAFAKLQNDYDAGADLGPNPLDRFASAWSLIDGQCSIPPGHTSSG